ncbi:metalloprotease TIKI1 [Tachysurus ichikawai]
MRRHLPPSGLDETLKQWLPGPESVITQHEKSPSALECVIFALNQTLLQQESLRAGSLQVPYTTEDLIKHYNCGDLNSIIFNHDTSQVPNFNNVTLPPSEQITAQEIDSYFRQELIYKRNERMGKRVKALLEEHPDKSFFFAFGAVQHEVACRSSSDPEQALHETSPKSDYGYLEQMT